MKRTNKDRLKDWWLDGFWNGCNAIAGAHELDIKARSEAAKVALCDRLDVEADDRWEISWKESGVGKT